MEGKHRAWAGASSSPALNAEVHLRVLVSFLFRQEHRTLRHTTPRTEPAVFLKNHTTRMMSSMRAKGNVVTRRARGMMPSLSKEL